MVFFAPIVNEAGTGDILSFKWVLEEKEIINSFESSVGSVKQDFGITFQNDTSAHMGFVSVETRSMVIESRMMV